MPGGETWLKWNNTCGTTLSIPTYRELFLLLLLIVTHVTISWQEIFNSHFVEEKASNWYSRGTCWRVWCKSQRHRAKVVSLDYSDFCDFPLFRILTQSKPSWSLGWLKWASPCCPSFHHSWIPMIQKSRYDPWAVLEWIVQMFLPCVLLVKITTFSACNPESSCRKLIFKMV